MRVNTVDENRIEILLDNDEVNSIFGGYGLIDYDTPDCRIKIHKLLAAVMPKALLPLDCERILIEVKPQRFGCIISLTKIYGAPKRLSRKYRLSAVAFMFKSFDNLIAALPLLSRLNTVASELYCLGSEYAISAAVKDISPVALMQIGEFCKISQNTADAAKLKEYWQCITQKRAIQKLAEAFLK